jgi:Fibronectin type III domain
MNGLHFSAPALRECAVIGSARFLNKLILLVAALGLASGPALAKSDKGGKPQVLAFEAVKMIIEFNPGDQDVGVQAFLDSEEGWRTLKIIGPDGRQIFETHGKGRLREQGLTSLSLESAEPSLDELPLDEFLARFPEGEYTFLATTLEGDRLVGSATFTHAIPDAPVIVAPAEGAVVDPNNTVIIWQPVTGPLGIQIAGYQVVVEREDPFRLFDVRLPATATSVNVPPQFLDPDTEYNFEVLAVEAGVGAPSVEPSLGGNQTISSRSFTTQP